MRLMTNHTRLDYLTEPLYGSGLRTINNSIYHHKGLLSVDKQPLSSHLIPRFYLQNQLELSLGLKSSI